MRRKLLKMFLPFLGIGVVTIPVALTVTSCAEKGMPTKYISSILQTYRNEASINIPGDDDHIINVGIIGSFPDNPIKQDAFKEDIKNWDNTTSGKPYDQATADAISYSDVITAPIKTWITNTVKSANTIDGNNTDQLIKNIPGYNSFRDQYFTAHVANIKAVSSDSSGPAWVYNYGDDTPNSKAFKSFQCKQEFNKDSEDLAIYEDPARTIPKQEPEYLSADHSAINYQYLETNWLWSDIIWDDDGTSKITTFKNGSDNIFTVSYLVTFSPNPFAQEAPPVGFYVNADLRSSGLQ